MGPCLESQHDGPSRTVSDTGIRQLKSLIGTRCMQDQQLTGMLGPVRRVGASLRRRVRSVQEYIQECRDSLAPMPNPPGYEEPPPSRPLSSYTLKEHWALWKEAFEEYKATFRDDEVEKKKKAKGRSSKTGERGAKEEEEEDEFANVPEDVRKLLLSKEDVEGVVREMEGRMKYELSPEEEKKLRRDLAKELSEEDGSLRLWLQERMELFRLSVRAFLEGYREARAEGVADMEETLKKQAGTLKSMLKEADLSPEALEENKRRNMQALQDALQSVRDRLLTPEEQATAEAEVKELMRRMDKEAESEEMKRLQAQADQLLHRLQAGLKGAMEGAREGFREAAGQDRGKGQGGPSS